MTTSVKLISAAELEAAIATVLAEKTGRLCSVQIREMQFGTVGINADTETIAFTANATCTPPESGEPIPF